MAWCGSPTSSSSATSPAGSSRSATCSPPRMSRATRWPTCWPSPTTRRGRSGTGSGSATPSRPATRCCGPRSPTLYERIDPEDVLVFAGAEEAIFCLANVALGPGDHAIVTWPGYQSLYEVARSAGAEVTLHDLREVDGWALDVPRLAAALRPDDPAGRGQRAAQPDRDAPDPARVGGPGRPVRGGRGPALRRRGLPLPRVRRGATDCTAGADALERGVSLGVMSKSFAMAGLRIGWLASARPGPAGPGGRVQGLHDDLLVGTGRDPLDRRPARPRDGPRPVAGDHRGEPADPGPVLRRARGRVPLGPPAGRLGRLPAADGARCLASTSSRPGSSRRRACCSCPDRASASPATTSGSVSGGRICPRPSPASGRYLDRVQRRSRLPSRRPGRPAARAGPDRRASVPDLERRSGPDPARAANASRKRAVTRAASAA